MSCSTFIEAGDADTRDGKNKARLCVVDVNVNHTASRDALFFVTWGCVSTPYEYCATFTRVCLGKLCASRARLCVYEKSFPSFASASPFFFGYSPVYTTRRDDVDDDDAHMMTNKASSSRLSRGCFERPRRRFVLSLSFLSQHGRASLHAFVRGVFPTRKSRKRFTS